MKQPCPVDKISDVPLGWRAEEGIIHTQEERQRQRKKM
jgi:hypothetical protein